MTRSEFYRNAGLRYAVELAAADLTWSIDAYVEATGDDGTDRGWLSHARRALARATEGDEW